MKISFVEPRAPYYNFYTRVIKHLPMIGPIYLATLLTRDGHQVTIYNENMEDVDYQSISDSDVLCISIMTATAPRGYEVAQTFRNLNPKARIIMGGCHATFMPEEAGMYADHVVTGEGELVISDLIRNGGAKIVQGKPVEDLDSLPFPDFSLMHGGVRPAVTPISTSRGCPNDCIFCSVTPMFGRKYRWRSAESVFAELSRFKHKHVFFTDDNFGVNRKVTKQLLHMMIQKKVTPKWTAESSVKIAKDPEMLRLMSEAGCSRFAIGFESMNADTLNSYGKPQTPEEIRQCIDILHKHRIKVHGMFISEGYSDVYHHLGLDTLQLTVLTPILGSKLYRAVHDAGHFLTQMYPSDWKLFDGTHVVYQPDNMSPVDMQKQTILSLKKFYSPLYMLQLLVRGKIYDFLIRREGRKTIKMWESQNKDYYRWLQRTLSQAADGAPG